jgi:hypothetical protein
MQYQTMMMVGPQAATRTLYEEFRQLRNKAVRRKLFSLLFGRRHRLINLGEVQKRVKVDTRAHGGIKLVPVEKIQGSINRCHDFDADFRPLQEYTKERWVNIALAYSRDEGLPPVELVDLDDTYFVIDGHHRISVARMLGQREIEAEVTVWRKAALSGEGG